MTITTSRHNRARSSAATTADALPVSTSDPVSAPVSAPAGGAVSGRGAAREQEAAVQAQLAALADMPADSPDRARVRDRIIEAYLPLAEYLARRFRNRGEPQDDLIQVANLGLIKSVDGFDASRGAAFTSYAIPMIVGEIKRHFRDKGWDVRVPRRLQELRIEIARVTGTLAQTLGRSPTVSDLAAHLNVSEEDIIEGIDSSYAYRALSLQAPVTGDESGAELGDLLGDVDHHLENVEDREALRPLVAQLPAREQKIIAMRFFGNMTQTQIATQLGISQMHVSRLLSHALGELRKGLLTA